MECVLPGIPDTAHHPCNIISTSKHSCVTVVSRFGGLFSGSKYTVRLEKKDETMNGAKHRQILQQNPPGIAKHLGLG